MFVDRILYVFVYNFLSTTVMIYNNPDHLLVDPVLVEVSGGSVVTDRGPGVLFLPFADGRRYY